MVAPDEAPSWRLPSLVMLWRGAASVPQAMVAAVQSRTTLEHDNWLQGLAEKGCAGDICRWCCSGEGDASFQFEPPMVRMCAGVLRSRDATWEGWWAMAQALACRSPDIRSRRGLRVDVYPAGRVHEPTVTHARACSARSRCLGMVGHRCPCSRDSLLRRCRCSRESRLLPHVRRTSRNHAMVRWRWRMGAAAAPQQLNGVDAAAVASSVRRGKWPRHAACPPLPVVYGELDAGRVWWAEGCRPGPRATFSGAAARQLAASPQRKEVTHLRASSNATHSHGT